MTRRPDPPRQTSEKKLTRPPSKPQKALEINSLANLSTTSFDEADLLERAALLWLHGDWENLIQIDSTGVKKSTAKARLALLRASAYLQIGNTATAEKLIRLALKCGCSRNQAARILLSGAYSNLACAAALAEKADEGLQYFENTISITLPGAYTRLLADTRSRHQLRELGLSPDCEGRLQRTLALAALEKIGNPPVQVATPVTTPINSAALTFYQNLQNLAGEPPPPFLLIDSKSMPRSGLHYLKDTLARLLGKHFSFCEWYQEVGCCRQRPCILTGFATHARNSGKCRIRMIKSHDFRHEDPYLKTSPHLQRLILIRDPLFTLTSWFELEQLGKYSKTLAQHGIDMPKIWLSHEKEVLESAYGILDTCFEPLGIDNLASWLVDKSQYIITFFDRWVTPVIEKPDPYTHVVSYDGIHQYVIQLTKAFRASISKSECKAVDEFAASGRSGFKKKTDPFAANTASVAAYLEKYSFMFLEAASRIESCTPSEIPALLKS